MSADFFIDSNIAVYSVGLPSVKRDIARALIKERPCISTQVVMETVNVLIKKFKFEKAIAFENVTAIMERAELKIITNKTLLNAFKIAVTYKLSHWDGLIIASALEASCTTLYSEDLQHNQVIEGTLKIVNPFLIS
jgi:predicted nucleic acid-binding protein